MITSRSLTIRLLNARVTQAEGKAPRILCTWKASSGEILRSSYGVAGQQREIADGEFASAGIPGCPAKGGLKWLCMYQEALGEVDILASLETDPSKVDDKGRPYENLRLMPKLRNMDAASLADIFGDVPAEDDKF
jgi:hypothetical protein